MSLKKWFKITATYPRGQCGSCFIIFVFAVTTQTIMKDFYTLKTMVAVSILMLLLKRNGMVNTIETWTI